MKIAICDDMQAHRALLEKYITEWGKKTGQDVQIAVFAGSEGFSGHSTKSVIMAFITFLKDFRTSG